MKKGQVTDISGINNDNSLLSLSLSHILYDKKLAIVSVFSFSSLFSMTFWVYL